CKAELILVTLCHRKGRLSRHVNYASTTQLCPKNGLFSTPNFPLDSFSFTSFEKCGLDVLRSCSLPRKGCVYGPQRPNGSRAQHLCFWGVLQNIGCSPRIERTAYVHILSRSGHQAHDLRPSASRGMLNSECFQLSLTSAAVPLRP